MEGFVLFLMIVFGILQIILFFKIWGATNDIDKLKSTICDKTHSVDRDKYIRKMYLLNKSNEGKEPLDNLINKAEKIKEERKDEATEKMLESMFKKATKGKNKGAER